MLRDVLTLTERDRGRDVPVRAGQEFELRLSENPTSGMRWEFVDHAGVEIVDVRDDMTRKDAPGVVSDRVFRLRVLGGDTRISLHRTQAWDPAAQPDERFHLRLVLE